LYWKVAQHLLKVLTPAGADLLSELYPVLDLKMSIFSLFGSKATRSPDRLTDPSGLNDGGTTQPSLPGSDRKSLRLSQRELLYSAVRDEMIRAGVLAASYRFKVLSLDAQGSQYLIMMDVLKDGIGELKSLSEIESSIMQAAKVRHDLSVTGVYWRNELQAAIRQTSVTSPPRGLANTSPAIAAAGHVGTSAPSGKAQRHQKTEPLKSAHSELVPSGRKPRESVPEFEDTRIIAPNESGSPLSATQYGDLN
jgi:hypothetical protein